MKKIVIFLLMFLFGSIFIFHFSYGENNTCSYGPKIISCLEANKNGTTRMLSESEGFVCIEGSKEEITYQIVFDEEFSKIDTKIEKYLDTLETDKDKYFGPNAESNYIEASDELEQKFAIFGEYWKEYRNVCGVSLIKEVINCQDGESSTINSSNFFKQTSCEKMANLKLYIYGKVAYDILMLNKLSVREDSAKEHLQLQRFKYDELLNNMMINSGYMERISKKWPSVLKNTH